MNENKNIHDDELKNLVSETKIKAPENLRYRIMHQIQVEVLFRKKNTKERSSSVFPTVLVVGIIYSILLIVAVFLYLGNGKSCISFTSYLMIALSIVSVSASYLAITIFDEIRLNKAKKESKKG